MTTPATEGTPGIGLTPSLDTLGELGTDDEARRSSEGFGSGSSESE